MWGHKSQEGFPRRYDPGPGPQEWADMEPGCMMGCQGPSYAEARAAGPKGVQSEMRRQTVPAQGTRLELERGNWFWSSAGSDPMALKCHEKEAVLFIHLAGKNINHYPLVLRHLMEMKRNTDMIGNQTNTKTTKDLLPLDSKGTKA